MEGEKEMNDVGFGKFKRVGVGDGVADDAVDAQSTLDTFEYLIRQVSEMGGYAGQEVLNRSVLTLSIKINITCKSNYGL